MSDNKEKFKNISFGKLFIIFMLFFLIVLFVLSIQASVKTKQANKKLTEEIMASELDFIFSDTTEAGYVYNHLNPIVKIAMETGIESNQTKAEIENCLLKYKISGKFFFYNNNEFVKAYNATDEDIDFFKNLLIYMSYERGNPNYLEANRKPHKKLQEYFGLGHRVELMKLHKGLVSQFLSNETNQFHYWDSFENGFGFLFFTTEIPDYIERLKINKECLKLENIGAIDSSNKNIIAPKGLTEDQTLVAYIKSTKTGKSFVESNNNYWYFQTTVDSNKICSIIPSDSKPNNYLYYYEKMINIVSYVSVILFTCSIIIYITNIFNLFPGTKFIEFLDNLSIRHRMIGLFSMASICPVIIAFLIGALVIKDKERVIEEAIFSESLAGIYNIENQFKILMDKTEKVAYELREAVKNEPLTIEMFENHLKKHNISTCLARIDVRDANINTLLTCDDREIHGVAEVMDLICRIALKLHNPERLDKKKISISPAEVISEAVFSTDELGFATIIRQRNKQWNFKVGNFPTTWYWEVYPELATGPAFMCFTSQPIATYKTQIEEYFKTNHVSSDSIQLYAFMSNPLYKHDIFPQVKENIPKDKLIKIANTSLRTNKVLFRKIRIDGKGYWVTAKHETDVGSHVFFHLIDQTERFKVLNPIKWQLTMGGLFALFISILGAWFITNLIILPVSDLSKGINAIRFRYKDFRIPIRRKDEFGELATAFNKVIEEFDELEYGKIVQESLLPASSPKIEGYDIAYYTISATDLAGDYHDNVILDDGRLSIILGDVSGHGISASLAMAMAKATFNYAKSKKVKFPEEFMDMANTMFNKELKPRNKLMTLISMVLTPETGEVTFDNAGQAYPAFYTASTETSEEIKMPSLPLGGMKKRKRKPITRIMNHGDAFIFYTDGIIEASAADGEMFGYERFYSKFTEQMRNKVSSKDAISNIYQAMEDFRELGPRSDDITMIIVKRL